ncbi:MAG: YncE family protein [Alistipes sp.]|nr:YncE family protein [Alistipes senegalensis]MCM1250052.1 YncE family protein [Alistipes sp.]
MTRRLSRIFFFLTSLLFVSCMEYGPMTEERFDVSGDFGDGSAPTGRGLFIVNEGNFMYGNASLSYYDPETKHAENEVFARANAQKLGDVAQSMTLHGGLGWTVVNNSGVVFALDPDTFREAGRITGFTSPRYIHFVSDEKAYVTQIWDPRICIVDPRTYRISGYIETGMDYESGSTEQMVQYGKYVFTNCWSYQNRILKIDTETDTVVDELVVGIQPASLVLDCNDKLWVITDGGYEGSPYGYEAPSLCRIDAATFAVEKRFAFRLGDRPSEMQLNGARDKIYWLDDSVWCMDVTADRLPVKPFLPYDHTLYYGLTVNPVNGDVYVADAIDYVQSGVVLRYSAAGELLDRFRTGIAPGAFCWR